MDKQLMVHVEQAVRPVSAPLGTKLRMRRELYEHLAAVHAEELSIDGDQAAALQRSLQRFGAAEDLSAELQQTLNWHERFEVWEARLIGPRPSERPVRGALRIAAIMLGFVGVAFVAVGLVVNVLGTAHRGPGVAAVALIAMLTIDAFILSWLVFSIAGHVRPPATSAWRQPRVWISAVAAAFVVGGLGLSVMAIASRSLDVPMQSFQVWSLLSGVTILIFMGSLIAYQAELRRVYEWDSLDLTPLD